jgi:hypothetical protein
MLGALSAWSAGGARRETSTMIPQGGGRGFVWTLFMDSPLQLSGR